MKAHILYKIKDAPFGGVNQFLKALRNEFVRRDIYEQDAEKADIILFDSFPFNEEHKFKLLYKYKKAGKVLVHRIDGPIDKYRAAGSKVDHIIYKFNNAFADGTVFQSSWSREENIKYGLSIKCFETIVINAPDESIFNRTNRKKFDEHQKIKIIATSWSKNLRKGFSVYQYLDEHLDFNRFEMTFVGNSPILFSKIRRIEPLVSSELAEELKKHDIFITASQSDPCSNSLIEAMHCGLPAVVLNDGGHPEIVNNAGEFFNSFNDVIEKIEKVAKNYNYYQNNINLPGIQKVADNYLDFFEKIFTAIKKNEFLPKKVSRFSLFGIIFYAYWYKYSNFLKNLF